MDGKSTRGFGIALIVIGGIIFASSGLSEIYFGVRHVFYESPLYPLSVMFIITGLIMILGGTIFNDVKRKRYEAHTIQSLLQVGGVIQGIWKQGKQVNLNILRKTLGISRESLKLKIFEAMGQGILEGVFEGDSFLPRNFSNAGGIPVSKLSGN